MRDAMTKATLCAPASATQCHFIAINLVHYVILIENYAMLSDWGTIRRLLVTEVGGDGELAL